MCLLWKVRQECWCRRGQSSPPEFWTHASPPRHVLQEDAGNTIAGLFSDDDEDSDDYGHLKRR